MSAYDQGPRVTAVLGPTNTGKTYLAIERMLDHETGMIGFPLRLLARENYDRVVRIKGARRVALVTGEEKIIPTAAKYFICTVESMPLDREVEFLAVDEIQMCADPERGHVFTDRMLRARGTKLTMFLGAETVRPIIRRLVPEADFVTRPRLSQLTYTGPRKLSRLPRRSAVVAFSAGEVYAVAELLRRQRGGAAVVLGALSPRTRNAQVEMYQQGEVDYLVATDAIGMGLNMNVDHVVFRALKKFDGRVNRRLTTSELAQIAGRAGRYMSNGTFGTAAELGALDAELVEAIESHRFDPLKAAQWRNSELKFGSILALQASLDIRPSRPELVGAREADDQRTLTALGRDPEIAALATHPEAVRLLWDVCQIPDFRKTMAEAHNRLLAEIYRRLMSPEGRLPTDWIADQVTRLDRADGDIDTLMARIAHIRTWTYISHRADWLDDANHWRARARGIEDRLSDALHERLTQRFVDRRAAALTRLRDKDDIYAVIGEDGEVTVEGEYVGRLEGFLFRPDATDTGEGRRALMAAANRVLRREIASRVTRLAAEEDTAFTLEDDGTIAWRGARVARLGAGDLVLSPRLELTAPGVLSTGQRERVRLRLSAWFDILLGTTLRPLTTLRDAELDGVAGGLAYQLVEALGSLPRKSARSISNALTAEDRKALRGLGVRFGFESVFAPALVKPKAARLRALLWAVHNEAPIRPPPPAGLNSVIPEPGVEESFYEACGYRFIGGRALRIDILDRLAVQLARAARKGPFTLSHEILSLLGMSAAQAAPILNGLGYRADGSGEGAPFVRAYRRGGQGGKKTETNTKPRRKASGGQPPGDPDSPFAKLRDFNIVK